jgi:16S rRNA (guanine527-N7)-methyltransferase
MKERSKLSDIVVEGAKELKITLSDEQVSALRLYMGELLLWNQRINLTTITGEKEVVEKHFLDSLTALPLLPPEKIALADVGAGAGFPGIPLKIARPDIQLTLLDSVRKKTSFLHHMARVLKLDFEVVQLRSEDAARSQLYREKFDVVISRAVAEMPTLSELCLPLVAEGGLFLAMKGLEIEEELDRAQTAIEILGGSLPEVTQVRVPQTEILRSIVQIKKIHPTPDRYPRRAGIPEKRPITKDSK